MKKVAAKQTCPVPAWFEIGLWSEEKPLSHHSNKEFDGEDESENVVPKIHDVSVDQDRGIGGIQIWRRDH